MTWILEEPIYILVLGIVMLVFLGFVLIQTGYRGVLHAMLGVAALTVGLLILERSVETRKEQIEAALHDMARDVQSNDLDAVYSHVYSGAPEVLADAKREFPRYTFHDVNIKSNMEVTFEQGHEPPKAFVTFNVVVDVQRSGFRDRRVPRFVRLTLIHEQGQWRVADYSHENPVNAMKLPAQ